MRTIVHTLIVFCCLGVAADARPQDAQPTQREQELEALVRQLIERVDRLERRVAAQEQELRQAADAAAIGAAQGQPPVAGQDAPAAGPAEEGDLANRVARLEERANRHPNPLDIYWKEGIRIESEDGDFKFRIGGRMQLDGAIMDADDGIERNVGDLDDGVEFRRARLYISGDIYENAFFKFQYDFAGGDSEFKDVYAGLRNQPVIGNVKIGHFKEPFGLEELTSSNYITFMERSAPNEAFAPARNTGLAIYDTLFDQRMTWAAGVFVNTDDFGDGEFKDDIHYTARLTGLPWYEEDGRKLLHLGIAYSHRNLEGDRRDGQHLARFRARPEVHLAPRFVNTGRFYAESQHLIGAEAALVHGPFSLQGEYFHTFVDGLDGFVSDDPDFNGFYVQASYFLTGEHRNYKRSSAKFDKIKPLANFGEDGWGAWEVAARYSYLDLDDKRIKGGKLNDFTFGLNWYLNPNMRMMFNYVLADQHDFGDANMFQMRLQVNF